MTAERVVTRWVIELLFSITLCFFDSGCSSSDEKSDKEEAITTFFASETNNRYNYFQVDTQWYPRNRTFTCVFRLHLNRTLLSLTRQHYKGRHDSKPTSLKRNCHRLEGKPADSPGTKTTAAWDQLHAEKWLQWNCITITIKVPN